MYQKAQKGFVIASAKESKTKRNQEDSLKGGFNYKVNPKTYININRPRKIEICNLKENRIKYI